MWRFFFIGAREGTLHTVAAPAPALALGHRLAGPDKPGQQPEVKSYSAGSDTLGPRARPVRAD